MQVVLGQRGRACLGRKGGPGEGGALSSTLHTDSPQKQEQEGEVGLPAQAGQHH